MPDQQTEGQRAVAAMMAADRASAALGIEIVEVSAGRATARMRIRQDMVNGHDLAHGGLVFTLADTAFACACNSLGPVTVAAAAEIVFVRPARLGDELIAEAVLRTRFGRNGIYDVTVRRGVTDTSHRIRGTDGAVARTDGTDESVIAEFRGRSQQSQRPARQ